MRAFINLFSKRSYHIERFLSGEFRKLLENILNEKQFDCIIFESIFVAAYRDVIPKTCNAVIVLREHNVEHRIWERLADNETFLLKRWYLRLLSRRLRKFETEACTRFDGVTTVTDEDASYLRSSGCTVPLYSSPAIIEIPGEEVLTVSPEENTLFHIGSMDWMPNIEGVNWFLKEVMPAIHQNFPQLKLHLAGRNMPETLMNTMIPGVVTEGEVSSSVEFILSKKIMIVPLLSGSGIRVKIIEGMALGKTIISTAIGAEGIPCENRKNILLANTPEEFSNQISWCLSNPEEARQVGLRARKLAEEHFSMKAVTANVLQFYQTLRHSG